VGPLPPVPPKAPRPFHHMSYDAWLDFYHDDVEELLEELHAILRLGGSRRYITGASHESLDQALCRLLYNTSSNRDKTVRFMFDSPPRVRPVDFDV
jgi:hypothetical protein